MGFNLDMDDDVDGVTIDLGLDDLIKDPQTQTPTVEDKQFNAEESYTSLANQISDLTQVNQQLTNTLNQLMQNRNQPSPIQTEVDDDTLSELFTDVDKGKRFLSSFKNSIVNSIDTKLAPVVNASNQQQVNNAIAMEFQQAQQKYGQEFINYVPVMQQIISNIPGAVNSSSEQLFLAAKRMYPNYKPQSNQQNNQPQQQQNRQNVTNLPPRIKNTNTELAQKEIGSVREAMEAAMDELGMTG